MPCGREIRLRRVKSLRRWGFISFHLMWSGKYHNLQSKLFHREQSERFHFLLRLNALNIGREACQGSEHRAACGRWSGALSRKKQRAVRRAPRPRWLHITRFRLWRKLIHYAPRPLPKMRAFWGTPLQGDYVSDRKGRWFESNRGSQKSTCIASAFSIKRTFGAWKMKSLR